MAPQSCVHRSNLPVLATLVAVVLLHCVSLSTSVKTEAEILMKFKESLKNTEKLNDWNPKTPPCEKGKPNWVGIVCRKDNVWGIQLDNMGLSGKIDVEALLELENFRGLSLQNNNFEGPFPPIYKLKHSKAIYLSGNKFTGELSAGYFKSLKQLRKFEVANNQLTGEYPKSLEKLEKLQGLRLEGNKFTGEMPILNANVSRRLGIKQKA